ncbi:MAG: chromosome segregation SMC family protein [Patescibacteria group bacterium]
MHLERLEIQGFKSFASKNILMFPDPKGGSKGITAIVGPNGSGKSNIADAVRWALGEQSMKTLRGKKSEDVIFSGSDKKGKLGMAEVSLYFNNENSARFGKRAKVGKNTLPDEIEDGNLENAGSAEMAGKKPEAEESEIEYSQVVLTRRLFRDGESDYLLNGLKARLSDIQMFLAKAKFGQRTYSVIGQGTVEGFLNTSLAERKEFFDEATGVKQFQIKRDDSLNKLRASFENLNQASLLLDEISPRLRTLTRQVEKLKKRDEIEAELKELQQKYYGRLWQEINGKFSEYNRQFLELEKVKKEKEKKMELLKKEHIRLEAEGERVGEADFSQKELSDLQSEKEKIVSELARLETRAQMKLETEGKYDLSWMKGKIEELSRELVKIEEEKIKTAIEGEGYFNERNGLQDDLDGLNEEIRELEKKYRQAGAESLAGGEKAILKKIEILLAKMGRMEYGEDLAGLKKIVAEIRNELEKIIFRKEDDDGGIKTIQDELEMKIKFREELAEKTGRISLKAAMAKEREKMIVEKEKEARNELAGFEKKIREGGNEKNKSAGAEDAKKLKEKLTAINARILEIKGKIEAMSRAGEEERKHLFKIQRAIQEAQNELNALGNRLGELRVSAARFETRLEDLEKEIRENFVDMKGVKSCPASDGDFNAPVAEEKISVLKRQMDLIGGLDLEIEKEYLSTKERHDFLSEQADDLTRAIASLEKIIRELDANIKERFDREFKIISAKFEEYFKILFSGGSAKIVKIMESALDEALEAGKGASGEETAGKNKGFDADPDTKGKKAVPEKAKNPVSERSAGLDKIKFLQKRNATGLAGIEIQATPPGKKIRSISMLSGGERALTAIALISAIISANPSPFVVLDEVDAALDESNSERLAKILDDLSHKTQFKVITHNRASMRRANILYGVTMQDDGASKLLSVKLEEAPQVIKK